MFRYTRAALAVAMVLAFASYTPIARAAAPTPPDAGKAVTFPYPAKAPVVVQLNGIGAARDRLTTLLKAALPDDATAINKLIDDGLKALLADRKLTAIPKDARVFLVVNDLGALFDGTPAISLLVPVTSYKAFRDSFLTADERKTFEAGKNRVDEFKLTAFGDEHTVYAVDLKEYVALSPDETTAGIYANEYTKATTEKMAPDVAKTLIAADLSVYVNFDVINDKYGDEIRRFKGLIDFYLAQTQMGGMLPGVNKKQFEAAKGMLKGVFQAIEDCRALVVALEFRPEGLNLRVQAQFIDTSDTAKFLKVDVGPLADVAKLPGGLAVYSGSALGPKFTETLRGLSPEFAPADEDEKGNAVIEKLQKELTAAGLKGEVSASAPDSALTITTYSDPKKASAALLGCYETMATGGRVHGVVLKDAPKLTANPRKHQGFACTEVKLAFDFDATLKDLPEGAKELTLAQMKRTVTEKQSMWIGTDGKSVVTITAKDWTAATAALDGFYDNKKTVGDTAGYKLTRKNLPADAGALVFLETGQTLTMLLDTFKALDGALPGLPKLGAVKPPKGEPTYIGVAITLKGEVATADVFIPATAIAAGRKLIDGLLKNPD